MHRIELKLARRMLADYMVIGMAIGNTDRVRDVIRPHDMLTERGQMFLEAIYTKNREEFADLMRGSFGFEVGAETAFDSILRYVREANVEANTLNMAACLIETMHSRPELENVESQLEEALMLVRDSISTLKESRNQCAKQ